MVAQDDLVRASRKVLIENYGRGPFAVTRGTGARIWDADAKEYIDLFPGLGGGGIGRHCHPKILTLSADEARPNPERQKPERDGFGDIVEFHDITGWPRGYILGVRPQTVVGTNKGPILSSKVVVRLGVSWIPRLK